jgi:hypothetical protein
MPAAASATREAATMIHYERYGSVMPGASGGRVGDCSAAP